MQSNDALLLRDITSYVHNSWQPSEEVGGQEHEAEWPIFIQLLGSFKVLKNGLPIPLHSPKADALLWVLALHGGQGIDRDALLHAMWPDGAIWLASRSLHNLVHRLRELLSDAITGASPVLHEEGRYRLNLQAGIGVDVICMEELSTMGDRHFRAGKVDRAVEAYTQALRFYNGDLSAKVDEHSATIRTAGERERLRRLQLRLLAQIANFHYAAGNHRVGLDYAQKILDIDQCREDACRMSMLCCVMLGKRSEAFRQYRLCEVALHSELNTHPESRTKELLERIRLNPDSIRTEGMYERIDPD